jgi:hypoxanthine phosphoribosyltransferase
MTQAHPIQLKCFVIMPSGGKNEYAKAQRESDFIFSGIVAPAVRDACGPDVMIVREADSNIPGAIDKRIVEHIATADIAIVDLTGHNANVFLELGIRYALKRSTTILLRQEHTAIPFDIAGYRYVDYDPTLDGIEKARKAIAESVSLALASSTSDSLVYNVFPELSVRLNSAHDSADEMSWSEFWGRLTEIESRLKLTIEDGRYRPHAILGMSNGGMFVADMLGRRLLTKIPITSFWVNRWDSEGEWFDNPVNDGVVSALKSIAPSGDLEQLEVLLVDDIVASGKTIHEAFKFISGRLPGASVWFLPLFSANQKYFDLIRGHIIWRHKAFLEAFPDESEIQALHKTQRRKLPYDKDIRST